jgi:hypothetical protein
LLVSQGLVIGNDISAQWIPAQAWRYSPAQQSGATAERGDTGLYMRG